MKRSIVLLILALFVATSLPVLAADLSPTGTSVAASAMQTRHRRKKRSFWRKHRDKLTVAGGTAGGALIGGIAGGKKGAAIGAIAGGGGSALYTYKLRKRHHRHRRP